MAVTFYECLIACASNRELVENHNRLRDTALGTDVRTHLERSIDRTSGYEEIIRQRVADELTGFVHFAHDIWKRIPLEARQ